MRWEGEAREHLDRRRLATTRESRLTHESRVRARRRSKEERSENRRARETRPDTPHQQQRTPRRGQTTLRPQTQPAELNATQFKETHAAGRPPACHGRRGQPRPRRAPDRANEHRLEGDDDENAIAAPVPARTAAPRLGANDRTPSRHKRPPRPGLNGRPVPVRTAAPSRRERLRPVST